MTATCRLFGVSRQEYYRAVKRERQSRQVATEVVAMIEKVRMRMPRIGTRKLYHLLAYSKKIMGFNVSQSLNACGAVTALEQAIANRRHPKKQLIHHSNRGLQYCCDSYQTLLEKHQVSCSMTESYDPYQNAVSERVNGILKHEFILGITIHDLELMNKLQTDRRVYLYLQ